MASVIRGSDNMDSAQVRPVLMAAQVASGTAVDFTGIPSWAQRITVVFSDLSTTGTSDYLLQIGVGSVQTTGYASAGAQVSGAAAASSQSAAGFVMRGGAAAQSHSGVYELVHIGGGVWVGSFSSQYSGAGAGFGGGRSPTLAGALDAVRITTANGTDTFDAGTISVMYE